MAETIAVDRNAPKAAQYEQICKAVAAMCEGETYNIANLANAAGALREVFGFFWVGFYLFDGNDLVLGPFQGPIACTRIKLGNGVSGKAVDNKELLYVPNVDEFPGHIACSADSKSEVVVPMFKDGHLYGVLDVDSDRLNDFDQDDLKGLQDFVDMLMKVL